MEDTEKKPAENSDPGQIIDVRAPADEPLIPTVEAAGDEPAGKVSDQAAVTEEPVTTEAASENQPQEPAGEPPGDLPAPALPAGHKAGAPIIAIAAAILLAIGLAAITVYAYMKTQSDRPVTETTTSSSQPESQDAGAAIDETSQEIDEALESTDAAADYPEEELSDEALGL